MFYVTYTLGRCYQNNNNSYKLLRHVPCKEKRTFEICEINSDLWRRIPHDFILQFDHSSVYLKGKTYWCASDSREYSAVLYLLSFDYSTERFARICLPDPSCRCQTVSISVVREEKLAVLLRPHDRPGKEIEIWISSPIDDETKVVSWSKIFAMEDRPQLGFCETSFLVDEVKKIAICRERWTGRRDKTKSYVLLQYIVGEDNEVTQLEFEASRFHSHWPLLFNYVPSLVQIQ
ncbi:F-box associated ubiquitination effector family protein [Raphanus sativus]|nr:F-box associated ubiquitination effector family protein [Raphanus sativus]